VSIFVLSFTVGEAFNQLGIFLLFGLGFGIPLLILSLLSGSLQRQLTTFFARHSRIINIIGGLILIGIAIYDLSVNWEMLKLFYT
jgi:cytochrome c-type biogenesis protein